MRDVGAPSRWSLVGVDGPGRGGGWEGWPEEETGVTTTTVGMSRAGPGAGGRCARGGFYVPSAECDREGEARRGEARCWVGLVLVWCSRDGAQGRRTETRRKRRKQQPENGRSGRGKEDEARDGR